MFFLSQELPYYEYVNTAQNGFQIPTIIADYAASVAPSYDVRRSQNVLVCFMGTNDVAGQLATTLEPWYVQYGNMAHATGFKVVIVPVPPTIQYDAEDEVQRLELDAWLQANYQDFADAYADILSVPETNDPTDPVYYPDGLHPSNALYQLWTPVIQAAVLSAYT